MPASAKSHGSAPCPIVRSCCPSHPDGHTPTFAFGLGEVDETPVREEFQSGCGKYVACRRARRGRLASATAGSPGADGPWRGVVRRVGRPLGTGWGRCGAAAGPPRTPRDPDAWARGSVGLSGGPQQGIWRWCRSLRHVLSFTAVTRGGRAQRARRAQTLPLIRSHHRPPTVQ